MAFDGMTVAGIRAELDQALTGGRIYKIAQTDKNELVLTIRPAAERGGPARGVIAAVGGAGGRCACTCRQTRPCPWPI